ncbi:MAG: alpha/beta fold hydrolase [Mariprofundaceae bacterium]|nr:alpha/beta fold hydrolase [Mariprofundaceae bacterium]
MNKETPLFDKKLYPFQPKTLQLNQLDYSYLDEGDSEQVVLMVHGNPSWSFYYRDLVLKLRNDYRCVVPDHIGCGLSDKPDDTAYAYQLQQRIDDVQSLIDHLGIKKNITLVVHDWGGMIGMGFAAANPDKIKRIVVLNTGAFRLPEAKKMPWLLHLCRTPVGALLIRGFNAFSWLTAKVGVKREAMSQALQQGYTAPYNNWKNRIATLRFVEDIPLKEGHVSYETVCRIEKALPLFASTPMLICWGMQDFVFDHHFLTEWQQRFPEADVHRFDDCGHYILEDASIEVNALIQGFLEENST